MMNLKAAQAGNRVYVVNETKD